MRCSKWPVFFLFILLTGNTIHAQNRAIILQSVWNNDLNNYNPKEFLDRLFEDLRTKLLVKELIGVPQTFIGERKDPNWDQNVKERVKITKGTLGNVYFIALAAELRLPAFNLGKFLFKNPPRSSKLTLTLHVYDTSGVEVLGDTLINRGCLVKTIDEKKGARYFYTDYLDFMSDMHCHLEYIRKVLQEKPPPKK